MGATDRYPCPGADCDNAVATPAHWDEDAQRWIGRTCATCEKRWRRELSEEELALYARDPFLSGRALRFIYSRRSPVVNDALAGRGVEHLQASLAAELGVDADTPAEPLVPYWPQYRSDPPPPDRAATPIRPIAIDALDTEPPEATGRAARLGAAAAYRTDVEPAPPPHRRRRLLVAAWAAAVVAVLAAAAMLQLRDDEGDVATAPTSTSAPARPVPTTAATRSTTTTSAERARTNTPRAAESRSAPPRTTAPQRTTVATSSTTRAPSTQVSRPTSTTAATTTTVTAAPTTSTIPTVQYVRGTLPLRWAEYADGIVYLRGRVPNQQTADEITEIAAGVVGRDNVRVEYVIDPKAPLVDGAPLYVRDAVPFDPDEAAPGLEAYPVLDLGVVLLEQNPQMVIEIGGHTDDQGPAEYNLELSRQRASVVRDYLIERGANPKQVVVRAYGETQPIVANDTPEGREANRRIELSVFGLLS